MKKNKYQYHPELKSLRHMNVPINKVLLPMMQSSLELLFKFQLSNKKFKVDKFKIKSFDDKLVKFIVYTPKVDQLSDKCLYFIHGGGFVFNSSPHHYKLAKIMGEKLKCKVIYINYRLAPKYKYPHAPLDCFTVYKWILNNAKELNIDVNKIIIMGDSAGGNLAASTTLRAYENNLVVPSHQILLYPVLTKNIETESIKKYVDTPMCNSKDMHKYGNLYYDQSDTSELEYKAPYFSTIFEGYPKTYIEVAEYDCLHDDGVLFFKKLEKENVDCSLTEVKSAMHGYDFKIKSNLVKGLIKERAKFCK